MRAERGRKKKLVVAFHFQKSNAAAWKCDVCRSRGLEEKRRCGWLAKRKPEGQPVWARGGVGIAECPKSFINPESLTWIEEFNVRKLFGFGDVMSLPARAVDAFCTLEREIAMERMHADERT
jgi:hypothetical protein